MAKTGGAPTTSFKIWEVPEDVDRTERLTHKNPEIDWWRSRVNEHQVGGSAEKQVPKMTKFPRRCASKGTAATDNPKKTPENMKIPADVPKAPVKPRHAAKKVDGVPKRLEFPEAEEENPESMDSGFGASQPRVDHRYPTRARISAQATQNDNRNQTKSSNAKPAKPKRFKNPPDGDKENDGSAANGAQRQGTSSNKKRLSGFPVNRLGSQNLATPEVVELNSTEERLSQCSSDDLSEDIRWLQSRRDFGLWIECTRKGCGKWRYAEGYHDPLDLPKIWFCEMNTDTRFADCSIPQEEIPEGDCFIESAYSAGSIVWARVNGFPWWPAMVDDCPELLKYYEVRGSSTVPYKYHVKFFNEMKIVWLPVKNLKSYVENPRRTFLKKTVYQEKEYAEELDVACDLADQALLLPPLERLERFSWAAQVFDGARLEDSNEGPAKKKKSTNKSTVGPRILTRAAENAGARSPDSRSTRKQTEKRNMTENWTKSVKENVPNKQAIDVRSRNINFETDSAINTGRSTSELTGVPIRKTPNERRPVSGNQSQRSLRWDKDSFTEPNQLFEGNSSKRSEVNNSKIDADLVSSPPSESGSRPDCCEKRKRTEPEDSQRYPKKKSVAEILEAQLLSMSTQELIILICSTYQDPSLAKELSESTANGATDSRAAT